MSEATHDGNPAEGAGETAAPTHELHGDNFQDGRDAQEEANKEASPGDDAGQSKNDGSKAPEYGVKSDDRSDAGQADVQERMDEAEAKGYFGETPDPTPNENYTLQTPPDAPTPETDEELARSVGDFGRFSGRGALDRAGRPIAERNAKQ
jgi:hypothetical protein